MKKVLIIASGPSAAQYRDFLYRKHGWTVVAVNNAWKAARDHDWWLRPKDFSGHKPTPEDLTEHHKIVDLSEIAPAYNEYGGAAKCVGEGSVTLSAMYWALHKFKPRVIGVLGSDMNYEPDDSGNTHFYGKGFDIQGKTLSRGKPDPFFQARRFKGRKSYPPDEFMIYLYSRFFTCAKEQDCRVLNFSNDTKSLLPYPQKSPVKI